MTQNLRRGLYYPFINIPEGNWLNQSLLYWDELSCIAPEEFVYDIGKFQRHMQDYIRAGLVIPLDPAELIYSHDTGYFVDGFLKYLDQESKFIHLREAIKNGESCNYVNIHLEKIDFLIEVFKEMGFVRKIGRRWVEVEASVAEEFMTYLAFTMGMTTDYEPVTTEDGGFLSKINIPNQKIVKGRAYDLGNYQSEIRDYHIQNDHLRADDDKTKARDKIITNLLPAPQGTIDVREIIDFKEKNYDRLSVFRDFVEKFLISYESLPENLKKNELTSFLTEAEEMKTDLIGAMNHVGWKSLGIYDYALYAVSLVPMIQTIITKNTLSAAIGLSTMGLSILKTISNSRREIVKLNEKPLAYVVNASRRFEL